MIRTDQSPRFGTHVIRRLTVKFNHHRVYNLHMFCLAKVESGLANRFLCSSTHTEACTRREREREERGEERERERERERWERGGEREGERERERRGCREREERERERRERERGEEEREEREREEERERWEREERERERERGEERGERERERERRERERCGSDTTFQTTPQRMDTYKQSYVKIPVLASILVNTVGYVLS